MKKVHKKLGIAILATATLFGTSMTASAATLTAKEAANIQTKVRSTMPTSERVGMLKDAAIYYYWNGNKLKENEKKIFKGVTIKSNFVLMEKIFKEAINIDPSDENLQMDLASIYRMQNANEKAMQIYRNILNNNPKNYDARLKLAGLEKIAQDEKAYQHDMDILNAENPTKTAKFAKLFEEVQKIGDLKINTAIPSLPNSSTSYIVILGYALDNNGKMQKEMLKRLNVCLEAAKKYPNAQIITTGGVPKKGKTESGVMRDWLIKHGIKANRIIQENLSTNTVENSLFSVRDVVDNNGKNILLVTSASHMRRAYFLFNQAKNVVKESNTSNNDPNIQIDQVATVDNEELLHKVNPAEYGATTDDALRINGIWQLPGLQR